MQIPGHLAVALAQHQLPILSQKQALGPLLIGSLFPDIVDKLVGYGLKAMPGGRHLAHNIWGLSGTTLLVSLIWGKVIGFAWFMGYLGHLLADAQGHVPWLFPLKRYTFYKGKLSFRPVQLFRETLLLLAVLLLNRLSH